MGNPDVFWLNLTNAALGVVVLVCLLAVALGVVKEVVARRKARAHASAKIDRDMKELVASFQSDPHILDVPGLGVTMADGGEVRKPENSR